MLVPRLTKMDDDASVFGGDSPERQLLARGGRLWRCAEPVRLLGVQLDQHFEYDAVRDTKPPSFATVRRPIRSSASRDLVTISPQACWCSCAELERTCFGPLAESSSCASGRVQIQSIKKHFHLAKLSMEADVGRRLAAVGWRRRMGVEPT